jgi:hypothetical protein
MLPTSASAPSLRQQPLHHMNKIGQLASHQQKYRRRTFRNRPLIIIPLVLTGMLVVLGLAGFTVVAVMNSNNRTNNSSSTASTNGRPEQFQLNKEYFQDMSFLSKNASSSQLASLTSKKLTTTTTTTTTTEEEETPTIMLPSDRNKDKTKHLSAVFCKKRPKWKQ